MAIREARLKYMGLPLAILIAHCLAPSALAQPATAPASKPANTQQWTSPAYIDWLERRSMLKQSEELTPRVFGKGAQWQHQFAEPQPRAAVEQASVWLLAYPGSVITRPGESVMASWGDPKLWEAFG